MCSSKILKLWPVVMGGNKVRYLLRDEFTTDLAAGAVNGTAAEPGPGARTVVDVESKIVINHGGWINMGAQATPATQDEYVVYPTPITRRLGQIIYSNFRGTIVSGQAPYGFALLKTLTVNWSNGYDMLFYWHGGTSVRDSGMTAFGAVMFGVTPSFMSEMWVVLRAAGYFVFGRNKDTGYPLLYWVSPGSNSATVYAAYAGYAASYFKSRVRAPSNLSYIPVPMASDTFNRAAIGSTDGAAHAEANGGGGLAWTSKVGTVGISGGAAAIASAVDGGIAIATYPGTSPDGFFTIKPTKATTGAGRVLRYVDADNYLYLIYNGTNLVFTKRVAGAETALINAAAAGGNGKVMSIQLQGTKAYIYYDLKDITATWAQVTVPASTATLHGLYFQDTDSTLDDLVDWPSGLEGQHQSLLQIAANPTIAPVYASRVPDPAPTGCFSIAIFGDSQSSAASYPTNLSAAGNWLAAMAASLNIKCVLHVGDLVDVVSTAAHWTAVEQIYTALDGANIPYLVGQGQHDRDGVSETRNAASLATYNSHFPQTRFTGKSWWDGGFYDTHATNAYLLMSIDGVDYIFMVLEHGPRADVLTWADGILTTYAARKAIIITHSYMYNDDTRVTTGDSPNPHDDYTDCHDGEEIWTELIKLHDNVILVQSGDKPGFGKMTSNSDGGQAVAQILFDNQSGEAADSIYLRIITIDPTAKTIRSQTFSPNTASVVCDRGAGRDFTYTWTI